MERTKKIVVMGAMVWAISLSVVALLLPPKGAIDSSVLILLAQIIVLVATILGFHLPAVLNNGNSTGKKVG